jgi:N,N'-diacetyllegionaminate synthase
MSINDVKIEDRTIGNGHPCFIIAEIGSNHNGDLETAKKLIDVAVKAGADAVKFQSYEGNSLVTTENPSHKILNKYSLTKELHVKLNEYCKKKGIIFASTPFDFERLNWLKKLNIPFYKIASGDITYLTFIKEISKLGKPIILSTGTATLGEVEEAIKIIWNTGNKQVVLLHCVSRYPTKIEEVNLSAMNTMQNAFKLPVGFSDHTKSTVIPALAVAMGACVIEKHITLNEDLGTPDHSFALKPSEFKEMMDNIRIAEIANGSGLKTPVGYEKQTSRTTARRSIYTRVPIKKGETITEEKLKIVRPAKGLHPKYTIEILGKKANMDLDAEKPITFESVKW